MVTVAFTTTDVQLFTQDAAILFVEVIGLIGKKMAQTWLI